MIAVSVRRKSQMVSQTVSLVGDMGEGEKGRATQSAGYSR
jgi:hypothetical protein